jgi:hypothetical protein
VRSPYQISHFFDNVEFEVTFTNLESLINFVTARLREEYKEFQKSIKENLMEAEVQQEEDEVCDGNFTI